MGWTRIQLPKQGGIFFLRNGNKEEQPGRLDHSEVYQVTPEKGKRLIPLHTDNRQEAIHSFRVTKSRRMVFGVHRGVVVRKMP